MKAFDATIEGIVEADASNYAIGACLSQKASDSRMHPIAYYSRGMTSAELNYDIHDKELLAIVEALREWRTYLQGAQHLTKIYTDHKNLTYFTTIKVLNRRQVRWAELLATYDFQIIYKKGSENLKADILSRRTDLQGGKYSRKEGVILREQEDGSLTYDHPQLATMIQAQEPAWIERIKANYGRDEWTKKIQEGTE